MKRLIVLSTFVVALAGLAVVAPSVVMPEKAPQAQAHDAYTNGCSVPGNPPNKDTPGGFNFHPACDNHDRCYVFHWYGHSDTGRYWCDVYFSNQMGQECARHPWWTRWNCNWLNETYYRAVRIGGGGAFWNRVSPPINVHLA
jgi:Prokaryotic phospholipase A2